MIDSVLKTKSTSLRRIPNRQRGSVARFFWGASTASLLLLTIACQTTPLVYLPDSLHQKFFGACGNSGSISFKVFRNSEYLVSGFIDWDRSEGLQISNVMGNTIALLKHNRRADIQLPNTILNLDIDAAGRIHVNARFSGLYLEELFCLFAGRVPSDWHQQRVVAAGRDYRVTTSDSERRITTMVGVQRFRVELARRILWLFTAGEIVIGSYRRQTGYLLGQGFRLSWEQLP